VTKGVSLNVKITAIHRESRFRHGLSGYDDHNNTSIQMHIGTIFLIILIALLLIVGFESTVHSSTGSFASAALWWSRELLWSLSDLADS